MEKTIYVFDFDSTFTQVEAMEELAEISLAGNPELDIVLEKIKQLTDLAMDGSMPFSKSLKARIALLSAKKYHIQLLVNRLRKRVSTSFIKNKAFFKKNKGNIYIVSGGFKEFIVPVVKAYHIDAKHVFANTFVYDKKGNIIGADADNFLAQENGKVKLLQSLKLEGKLVFVGDGYTDWEVFNAGLAHQFFAYTENISREKVVEKSEFIAPSLDEILYTNKQPMAISYPKNRLKVVCWGEETFLAEPNFRKEGFQTQCISFKTGKKALQQTLTDCQVLIYQNGVKLDWVQPEKTKLLAAGVWGEEGNAGYAKLWGQQGIVLFESKYADSRSLAELALMQTLFLCRSLGAELSEKRLGILGYGNAGSMFSVLASSLGMDVSFYDVKDKPALGNVKKVRQLSELLKKSDILVMMAGKRSENEPLLGLKELKLLPQEALVLNMSFDHSTDLFAVAELLRTGKLGGFAMDILDGIDETVFKGLPVQLTYKQRWATCVAQSNISSHISNKLLDFVNSGNTQGACNFPGLHLPPLHGQHRFVHIHQNKPGVLAQINSIMSKHGVNIVAQYLQTDAQVGYVITDVNKNYHQAILKQLKDIAETIKFRVLY